MYYNLLTEEISFLPIIKKNELEDLFESSEDKIEVSNILKSLSFLENNNEFCELYTSKLIILNIILKGFNKKLDQIRRLIKIVN